MNEQKLFRLRLYITGLMTFAIWVHLLWAHYHGGVPAHHILDNADLPSISNWWGGLLFPVLAWFLIGRINTRSLHQSGSSNIYSNSIIAGFGGSLLFGIFISVTFMNGYGNITDYMVLSLPFLALFIPLYRAEYLLGFVAGMTFSFGSILPTGFGLLVILIAAFIYKYVRPFVLPHKFL